jgi:MFS family permease
MGWDLYTFVMPVYGSSIGLSASTIGVIMGTFAAATFAVRLAMPALSRHLKEWPMVIAAMAIAGVSYALFPLAKSVPPLMALSFLLGLGLGCAQPFIMSLLYAASPPGRQGEVIGVRTTMLNGSHTFLPLAMGALGAALGMGPVFWAMAAFLFSGAGFAWRRVK